MDAGAVWILFLNNDGGVKSHEKITEGQGGFTGILDAGDHFSVVAALGDLNADGVNDLAVGAPNDDDGGANNDDVIVIISGNADLTRSAGYWYQAYRGKKNGPFTPQETQCFLDIVEFMSTVFNEETSVATVAEASELLKGGKKPPMTEIFDRQLLAAWLNFANGAIDLGFLVDTTGDNAPDTAFGDVLGAAEAARLNPATTQDELEDWKDLLELINTGSL